MDSAEILLDGFGRIHDSVHRVLDGIGPAELVYRIEPGANTIAWLVWHLTRIQDDHLASAFDTEQAWLSRGWAKTFALGFDDRDTGYGHSAEDVASVSASRELLVGYFEDVHDNTLAAVGTLTAADLDRVVDRAWTPPVVLGVRLVSVINDAMQHVGQAAFIRGVAERR